MGRLPKSITLGTTIVFAPAFFNSVIIVVTLLTA
ncbi:hypothetical protein CY0110_17037 [Crocosphaera chwakensis CCY0110]|uniref:Uncharacterized protein n=1 Tax=Crocosphaera chwakensis CCY0110 TaxID=391612 RepID=A3II89_9CHRO|nr:hypothetical protein CY0110_17037 [Crocosphaera chwakensis CCY0110]